MHANLLRVGILISIIGVASILAENLYVQRTISEEVPYTVQVLHTVQVPYEAQVPYQVTVAWFDGTNETTETITEYETRFREATTYRNETRYRTEERVVEEPLLVMPRIRSIEGNVLGLGSFFCGTIIAIASVFIKRKPRTI